VSLDLKPEHLALVRGILAKQAPAYQAWAFGSRVQGTAHKFSDLDICLRAAQPMGYEEKANLKLAFSESNLPFVVDIVDLNRCSQAFARSIEGAQISLS
jgi:uncharacterized protein